MQAHHNDVKRSFSTALGFGLKKHPSLAELEFMVVFEGRKGVGFISSLDDGPSRISLTRSFSHTKNRDYQYFQEMSVVLLVPVSFHVHTPHVEFMSLNTQIVPW